MILPNGPYDPLRKLLLNFVSGAKARLERLCGLIRWAFDPDTQIQTGFLIYAPPGTGKSTFVNWLVGIAGSMSAEMVVTNTSLLINARLKGKSLILISDGDNLNADVIRLTKIVRGRDRIPYDWKHEILSTPTFVSFTAGRRMFQESTTFLSYEEKRILKQSLYREVELCL